MTPEQITKAGQDLFQAEKNRKQIKLLTSDYPDMKMDEAYAVQKSLVELKTADGCKVTGWKIGLTSKAMQNALNIDIPDSGILFDDMHFKDKGVVPKGRFIQPRIEVEIAFVMKDGLDGAASSESRYEGSHIIGGRKSIRQIDDILKGWSCGRDLRKVTPGQTKC